MGSKIKSILSSHCFEGVLLIAFGMLMLILPTQSMQMIGIIAGVILCAPGLTLAVSYNVNNKEKHTTQLFAVLMLVHDEGSPAFLRVKGVSLTVEETASLFVIRGPHIKDQAAACA